MKQDLHNLRRKKGLGILEIYYMKKFFEIGEYQQWIDTETGKSSCTCNDFVHRHLKRKKINENDSQYNTIQSGQCKHLKQIKLNNGKRKITN